MRRKLSHLLPHAADQRGATLLLLLVTVAVIGLSAGIAGSSWKTAAQREREAELLFRGGEYRRAIEGYYKGKGTVPAGSFPASLDDLVEDPRSVNTLRHLRRLYTDPMTRGEWKLILDEGGRIKGVRSTSTLEPFKKDGFSKENKTFRNARSYSDWQFVHTPAGGAGVGVQPGSPLAPGTDSPSDEAL